MVRKIDAVSEDIWSSMVNIPLVLTNTAADARRQGGTVISIVQIVGCWNGAVCLDMGAGLANQATASLIGADPAEISREDVRDAAGELANMTAGAIKELLPDPCQISLPSVVVGADFQFSVPQGVIAYRTAFDTPFGPFLVTLIRGEDRQSVQWPSGHSSHHGRHSAPAC